MNNGRGGLDERLKSFRDVFSSWILDGAVTRNNGSHFYRFLMNFGDTIKLRHSMFSANSIRFILEGGNLRPQKVSKLFMLQFFIRVERKASHLITLGVTSDIDFNDTTFFIVLRIGQEVHALIDDP